EMAPELQSKFLRVLDSGTFYRVGATRKRRADFRMVAATNRDLAAEVAGGRFRKDLFYRVNGVKVVIPPLRERPADIPLLVEHVARQAPNPKRCAGPALDAMAGHDWPGNVRELHFAVERACLLAEGDTIDLGDLPPEIVNQAGVPRPIASTPAYTTVTGGDGEADRLNRNQGIGPAPVRQALEQARWGREEADEDFGGSPRWLYRWIKRIR